MTLIDDIIRDVMRENELHLVDYELITIDGKRGVKIKECEYCFLHLDEHDRDMSDIDNFSKAMRRVMMDMKQKGETA